MKPDQLKDAMARMGAPAVRNHEDFWSDFRARAKLHPQLEPVTERDIPPWAPWLTAACAAALLAVFVLFPFGNQNGPASEILAVDVLARHSAVMIMNEDTSEGTVLWIYDMEFEPAGDST